jgi:hypothetical protein
MSKKLENYFFESFIGSSFLSFRQTKSLAPIFAMLRAAKRLFDQNPVVGLSWIMAGTGVALPFIAPPIR